MYTHVVVRNIIVVNENYYQWIIWFRNPINGVKELRTWRCISDYLPANANVKCSNPSDVIYWSSRGEGGSEAWKFRCQCGEVCSSYENFRYHPTGRMFQCTHCSYWAHTDCILGE